MSERRLATVVADAIGAEQISRSPDRLPDPAPEPGTDGAPPDDPGAGHG